MRRLASLYVPLLIAISSSGVLAQDVGLGTALASVDAAPSVGEDVADPLLAEVFKNVLDRSYPNFALRWNRDTNKKTVAVCWEDLSGSSETDRGVVRRAAEESWAAHSGLGFTGWAECVDNNRGIRIQVADVGPHTQGLGTKLDGKVNGMVLNFTFGTWSTSCARSESSRKQCIYTIAVHEFGHAIGFAHEHHRPDTPESCDRPIAGSFGDTLLTPWDPSSVMNYCNPIYGNAGVLSALDQYAVLQLYPR